MIHHLDTVNFHGTHILVVLMLKAISHIQFRYMFFIVEVDCINSRYVYNDFREEITCFNVLDRLDRGEVTPGIHIHNAEKEAKLLDNRKTKISNFSTR